MLVELNKEITKKTDYASIWFTRLRMQNFTVEQIFAELC